MNLAVYLVKSRATVDTRILDNPYPFSSFNVKKWGVEWSVGQLGVSVSWIQTEEEARRRLE